ncbi:HNH endonuclease [Sulfurovum sp. XTW-4]|uniref:HNH endonuclease n=1 Tax=Sulfurovum xiamenensis TaxID=3019066 RepID=A0ABT7QU30_9BACT|nr:HNH endonuclease [Sulfurovum xiamenensis]MDM5264576.1 HNH endonuclease [Sulfurovum xiamenensis]
MISTPVQFDASDLTLINSKITSPSFTSNNWSDSDLSDLKDKIKTHYLKVQGNKCPYCQQIIRSSNGRYWDIEHIISRATQKNFMFEPQNLCVSCVDCNSRKSNKKTTTSKASQNLPTNTKLYLIIHPHFDIYEEHIMTIKAGFYYLSLKPKGEKTIEICGLNRFYEFAEYNDDVADDDRIFLLSERLVKEQDPKKKLALRKEIAYLALLCSIES